MNKRYAIGKVKASKLFKKYQDMNVPGSNLLLYTNKLNLNEEIDAACIICSFEDLQKIQMCELTNKTQGLALKIQEKYLKTFQQFQAYFTNTIISFISQSQLNKQIIKAVFLQLNQTINSQILVTIIKYLQLKEMCLIIKPQLNSNNWTDYQHNLAIFSNKILENDYLVLSSISLVLTLPKIQCQHYSKYLLSIWRRTIPTEVGRLVIEDQGQKSRQLELLFIKNMELCWLIQYLTQNSQRLQQLSQRALGLI